MQSEHTERVYEGHDETQALALQSFLQESGVDCALLNHRDTAYPGIVDRVAGGIEILVAAEDAGRARDLIGEFLSAEPMPPEEGTAAAPSGVMERSSGAWFLPALLVFGVVVLITWYLTSR